MDQDSIFYHLESKGVAPKRFRVWDKLHNRWFQGNTNPKSIALQTDAVNYFGEILVMEGTLHDQNEDTMWKNDPRIHGSLDLLEHLIVVQDTGMKDETGKAIFEGDIVITDDNTLGYIAFDRILGSYVVVSPTRGTTLTDFQTCIIKGNVFEDYNQWFKEENVRE